MAMDSELAKAVAESVTDVVIAGRKLRLHKWTWRQSMMHGDKFVGAVGDVVRGKSLTDLMKQDVLAVMREQAEVMATILVDTIMRDNFESRQEASDWFDSIGLDDAVRLLGYVMKLNYVPLRDAFGELRRVVVESSGQTTATQ